MMASPVGDSDRVDWLATKCSGDGGVIEAAGRHCLDELERRLHAGAWRGPAADRAHERLVHEVRKLTSAHRELEAVAEELRNHARWIRERERHLRDVERHVRTWGAHHRHNLLENLVDDAARAVGAHVGITEHELLLWCRVHVRPLGVDGYPAPLTDGWDAAAEHLRRHGVHLSSGGGGGW